MRVGDKWITAEERTTIRVMKAAGARTVVVAEVTGRSPASIDKIVAAAGGLPPRATAVRAGALTLAEREEISRGLVEALGYAEITRRLGRCHTSTVSREVNANGGRAGYRAWAAHKRACDRARRPKHAKLACLPELRAEVEELLTLKWSPQQIAFELRERHPGERDRWVSHETIYQSIYVQGRGALRKELAVCLRTGRAHRQPRGRTARPGAIVGGLSIRERPAEIEDRGIPGHWEGDMIVGKNSRSHIGTLVERFTRYVMLLKLPNASAEAYLEALTNRITTLPEHLRLSLTYDRGSEMAAHATFTVTTGVAVYFCDPHSPWQRGSNENTNGLLRQWMPKGTDLSVHTEADLDTIAYKLNNRPRQTLGWMKPSVRFAELVAATG